MESHVLDHLVHCIMYDMDLKISRSDIKEHLDTTEHLNNFSRENHITYFIAYIFIVNVFKAHRKSCMVFKFAMFAGMRT